MEVRPASRLDVEKFVLGIHYARRMPSISFAFGIYNADKCFGVCTFGTPSSAPLRSGVCGPDFAEHVLELNRLCLLENRKNQASMLIGRSIKMLPKPKIIISYADKSVGHSGKVYQAANFIYTGLSEKRTDWKVRGLEHLHGQTIADMSRGCVGQSRAELMRQRFGDDFYLEERPRKHRYVYLHGSKSQKKKLLAALRYGVEPYPKGGTNKATVDAGAEEFCLEMQDV